MAVEPVLVELNVTKPLAISIGVAQEESQQPLELPSDGPEFDNGSVQDGQFDGDQRPLLLQVNVELPLSV
jgi:hypothetical protein